LTLRALRDDPRLSQDEMNKAVAAVIDLAGYREAMGR
jgi:hypothetical protein